MTRTPRPSNIAIVMATVYIIRHGETEWNLKGIHQGHMDSKLTEKGEEQAKDLGNRFLNSGISFNAIYSSDLGRALKTAEQICIPIEQEKIIQKEQSLRERSLGHIEGLTYQDLSDKMPKDYKRHVSGDPDYRPEGGESWRDFFNRAESSLKEIALQHIDEQILCVTHGGFVSMALRFCLNINLQDKRRFSIPNTAVNVFEFHPEDSWRLRTWGDISHFKNGKILDEML